MLSAPTVPDIPGSSRTAQRALHLTTSSRRQGTSTSTHTARPSHAQILGYARCACRMYAISGTPPPPPPQVSPETHLTLHMKICGLPVPGPRDVSHFIGKYYVLATAYCSTFPDALLVMFIILLSTLRAPSSSCAHSHRNHYGIPSPSPSPSPPIPVVIARKSWVSNVCMPDASARSAHELRVFAVVVLRTLALHPRRRSSVIKLQTPRLG